MNVLVTGATGFIGSFIAEQLAQKGYNVRCLARSTSNQRWLQLFPNQVVGGSLSDADSLKEAVEGVDYIYHVAGVTAARNEKEFLAGNAESTRNLLEAAKKYAPNLKRFLHMSSLSVSGPAQSLDQPITEDMPLNPLTGYARSKRAAELIVQQYADYFPYTIVRPPAVYGPRDTAILAVFQTASRGLNTVIGFNKKRLDLIHGRDLAQGAILAAESEAAANEAFFISSEENYSWVELSKHIRDALGRKRIFTIRIPHIVVLGVAGITQFFGKFASKPPIFNYEKGIDFIQKYWICSVEKARNTFGYQQMVPIRDGIFETVEWYKQAGWVK